MRDEDHDTVSPARTDGFIRGLSQLLGGPRGEHAAAPRPDRFWTPVRVVLALACLVIALNWVQKAPCMDSGTWVNHKQYKQACYTDVLALYYAERLSDGAVPYKDHPVEYPVLTGVFMGALGLPVHAWGVANPALNQGMAFYNLNAIVLGCFGVAAIAIMLAMRKRRPWDIAMIAVAPAMLVTATVNWDLFVICLTAGALYYWGRRQPVAAGVLLGLAVAAKFYPMLILGPLILLAIRARRLGPVLVTAGTALGVWLAINLPVAILWPESWQRFFDLNQTRPIDWGTFWYIGAHFPRGGDQYGLPWFQRLGADIPALNMAYGVFFVLCCAAIAALIFLARRRPRLAQVAFLVVAAFLLTGKVWSQQYVLWLLPLAVLARPRWGAFLAWQAAEFCYFIAFYGEMLMASGAKPIFPEWVFVLSSSARWITVAVLCGLVVRDILRPERDVVRQTYGDDPDGGVLDRAPDADWIPRLLDRFRRRETAEPAAPLLEKISS
ncbi:glycosyltransferase family 87 protein [Longispora albida]|uniref:glycosyltransferase family 87 protein n=1 Tax=Longispora albida TaxID=203523 RepID=UPI00036B6F6E|nr:glycosyltransferase 87 family protein [Longispora albida]